MSAFGVHCAIFRPDRNCRDSLRLHSWTRWRQIVQNHAAQNAILGALAPERPQRLRGAPACDEEGGGQQGRGPG
eukprot:4907203-Pyramimonas_sp.AAC.1